jgi:hypothetical protein
MHGHSAIITICVTQSSKNRFGTQVPWRERHFGARAPWSLFLQNSKNLKFEL